MVASSDGVPLAAATVIAQVVEELDELSRRLGQGDGADVRTGRRGGRR